MMWFVQIILKENPRFKKLKKRHDTLHAVQGLVLSVLHTTLR